MTEQQSLPDILTVEDIARYLRVSKTTICRWCKTGKLPAFRIGRSWRVARHDFEQHIRHARTQTHQQELHSEAVGAMESGQCAHP